MADDIVERLRAAELDWRDLDDAENAELAIEAATVIETERALSDRLKLEAQGHAQEARAANDTIYKIYQITSSGKGEPGNWHGAEPVRRYAESAEARVRELEAKLSTARAEAYERAATVAESRRSLPSRDVDLYGTTLAKDIAAAIRKLAQEDGK